VNQPKIILVTGNFNILHAGHLRLFKFAKDCGGRFLVGGHVDLLPPWA
jgi:cytidyltransferase-like protein